MSTHRRTRWLTFAVAAGALGSLMPGPAPVRAATVPGAPVPIAGSGPVRAGARAVGATAAGAPVSAVVYLRPRQPALLERTALRSSARVPMPWSRIRALFLPTAASLGRVRAYLERRGLRVLPDTGMSLRVMGTAAAADRAFNTNLTVYRTAAGTSFRAPSSAISLPASIAPLVQAVGGLQSNLRPVAFAQPDPQLTTPNPEATCAGATDAKSSYGGLLPQDIQLGYGFWQLQRTDPGANETIGLVEFSGFEAADVTAWRSCVTDIVSPFPTVVAVDGGNSSVSGRLEDDLDIDVVEATAPAAAIDVFEAPPNLGYAPDVIERMAGDGITVASDSWGLCEPLAGAALLGAENNALQIAAAAGMTFYAASGDSGASGCHQADGSLALAVDDPASQPFATGVGGSTASVPPGAVPQQSSWKYSGGGVSVMWPQPPYQAADAQTVAANHCTASPTAPCREVPDIAMDANPATGYITYCKDCFGRTVSWVPVGGTSGAAPLAAGVTALLNQYSLANGGQRLGFANPFLYSTAAYRSGGLADIGGPGNNIGGGGYTAGNGYDMVTGLGSLGWDQVPGISSLAPVLASYSAPAITTTPTTVTVTSAPAGGTVLPYPRSVTFTGHLQDHSGAPIGNVEVHLESGYTETRAQTNSNGDWSVTVTPTQNSSWFAVFNGSDVYQSSSTESSAVELLVRPELKRPTANLPYSRGNYHATIGRSFTVTGTAAPNMYGAVMTLEYHVAGGSIWHIVNRVAVGPKGLFSTTSSITIARTARYYRWFYTTHPGYRWQSAISDSIVIQTPA